MLFAVGDAAFLQFSPKTVVFHTAWHVHLALARFIVANIVQLGGY